MDEQTDALVARSRQAPAVGLGADIAVQRGGLHRRAMRLVVMDVDSTMLQDEAIDVLAEQAGCAAEVSALTEAAMRGEIDYAQALRDRVALLAGLDAAVMDRLIARLRLTPGARTLVRTLKRLGYRCGVVSGGVTQGTEWLARQPGLGYPAAHTPGIPHRKPTRRGTRQSRRPMNLMRTSLACSSSCRRSSSCSLKPMR